MLRQSEITARQDTALEAAKKAGAFIARRFGRVKRIRAKGDRDMVTDIDIAAEAIVKNTIRRKFPADNIISEENSLRQESEFSWVIDPLDGTHNFIHNIAIFGVSVALAYCLEVVLGVIYIPWEDELYFARKGRGTFLNKRRIYVSRRKLKEATFVFDSSIRCQKKKMLRGLGNLAEAAFNVRMFGSTARALAYVAEGKAEAEIEYNDKPWDFAAGLLLVEEAGGCCTDFSGKRWNINTKGYVASNGRIHKQVLALL